jgi:hypothetical protein
LVATASGARAYYGFTSGFETDTDGYGIVDGNPFDDPPAGDPPTSWLDVRGAAWEGLIEETPSGTRGIVSAGGVSHAEVYFQDSGGDRFGPLTHNGGGQQASPGGAFAFRIDMYLDPAWTPQSPTGDGLPDFEWVNFVDHAFSGGGTFTRGGITVEVTDPDNNGARNYVIASSDTGFATYTTETPGWYRFEVVVSAAPDGPDSNPFTDVMFEHNLYTLDHTPLWTETHQDYGQVNGDFLGGDAFSSFTYAAANIPFVAVDNQAVGVSVKELPEPGTVALLGAATAMLLRRRR